MLEELELSSLIPNPFNVRSATGDDSPDLASLSDSLRQNGLLVPIRVRVSRQREGFFEIVCGHRRYFAALNLGWKKIRSEIVSVSDLEMMLQCFVENSQRKEVSDYEKGLAFERMNREFGLTYDQIGEKVGISKQHVSNYIAMLRLFSEEELCSSPGLRESLNCITEHHARLLSRIDSFESRKDLIDLVSRQRVSFKELSNIVSRLRSWYPFDEENQKEGFPKVDRIEESDKRDIAAVVREEYETAGRMDFETFRKLHRFGEGFSLYSAFPPLKRFQGKDALSKEKDWFYHIALQSKPKIEWLNIELLSPDVALVTLTLKYSRENGLQLRNRGTMVLTKKESLWKIYHEHFSSLEETRANMIEV